MTHEEQNGLVEVLRLLEKEDQRQDQLHDILENIREQIRLGIEPANRPEGLMKNIQDAVYAMRGRTRLLSDAAILAALQAPQETAEDEVEKEQAEFYKRFAETHLSITEGARLSSHRFRLDEPSQPEAQPEPDFSASIASAIKEESEAGAAAGWRPCSGCHETNEGYETGRYPYSKMFGCYVGRGCGECGGLGVTWEYWSKDGLAAMQYDDPEPPEAQAVPEGWKPTQAEQDVLAERRRQIEVEGWTPEHDDNHRKGELLLAAKSYFAHALGRALLYSQHAGEFAGVPDIWPWEPQWWKPKSQRQDLIRAGALALSEIERIKRTWAKRVEHRYLDAEVYYERILAEIERLDLAASPATGGA